MHIRQTIIKRAPWRLIKGERDLVPERGENETSWLGEDRKIFAVEKVRSPTESRVSVKKTSSVR